MTEENYIFVNNKQLSQVKKLNDDKKYIFVYELSQKEKNELLDFVGISNFLTYIETLKILNAKYDFKNTVIIIDGVDETNEYFQIEDYLYAYAIMLSENNQQIFIGVSDYYVKSNRISYKDIVSKKENKKYHCSSVSTNKVKVLKNIMPLFFIAGNKSEEYCNKYIKFSDITLVSNSISVEEFEKIKEKAVQYVKIKDDKNKDNNNNNDDKSTVYDNTKYTNQIDLLKSLIKNNLYRFLIEIKGDDLGNSSKKKQLSKEKKIELINYFFEKYKTKFTSRNLLSQLIFCNSLRTLNENKEINSNFDEESFFELSAIEKCYCDSLAYAEGIYQLFENSISHTRFQILNFSLITYDVRIKSLKKNSKLNENTLVKAFEKRKSIVDKFFLGFYDDKGKTINLSTDYDANSYTEFIISDSAFTQASFQGIIDNFNNKTSKNKLESVKGLFERELEDEDVSKHYGIQLFEKNILINRGVFNLISGNKYNGEERYEKYSSVFVNNRVYRRAELSETVNDLPCYTTCYDILLPIKYDWENVELISQIKRNDNRWLYEKSVITNKYNSKLLLDCVADTKLSDLLQNYEEKPEFCNNFQRKKEDKVEQLFNELVSKYNKLVLSIHYDNNEKLSDVSGIEVLAKAIFLIISHRKEQKKEKELKDNTFIALFFSNNEDITEFIRIFVIFYDKTGKNDAYKNVQIALFLENEDMGSSAKMVSVIAGKSVEEIYNSALIYLYSNLDTSDNNIEQCKYITRTITRQTDSKCEETPLFPFDLFLPKYNDSYFKRNLRNDIENNDIRNHDFGIMIGNSNIRIGSGVHLESFYEAEILFHNYTLINKFAFIIASEIDYRIQTDCVVNIRDIIIIGYESYSSLLIQEIVKLLNKYHNNNKTFHYCIYTKNEHNDECLIYSPSKNAVHFNDPDKYIFFSVVPISTTFSTVYKIINLVNREMAEKYNCKKENLFGGHFSLITVNDDKIASKYWDIDKIAQKQANEKAEEKHIKFTEDIYVKSQRKVQEGIKVNTFLNINSDSYTFDPIDSNAAFKNDNPLVHVDKTSTVPNAVFKMFSSDNNFEDPNEKPYTFFNVDKANDDRINALKDYITYGHIQKKDNHYQYYIEKEKYCKNQEEYIIEWVKNLKTDSSGFNIIVSPLHNPDSIFLKMVLDNSFYHNYRLIHMPIYDTKRDEIRSKFSYIAKQFNRIKSYNSSAKVNFYFVDTSIVTGRTIARSLSLVRSLMTEFGLESVAPNKYSGVFTIVNRSTYNTISKYVENVWNDYHAYVYIYVPHFNTHNNVCPTCKLVEKYEYIEKCSSTNIISNEYNRLSNKHKVRSLEEYYQWLDYQILHSNSYYKTLKQWLYACVCGFPKNSIMENLESNDKIYAKKLYDEINDFETKYYNSNEDNAEILTHNYRRFTLNDYEKEYQNIGMSLYKNYIYKQKSFLRFVTTHNIVKILESTNGTDFNEQVENFESALFDYIKTKTANQAQSQKFEILISVIKVTSRPFLSQYYHVRKAIQNIIISMLDFILREKIDNEYAEFIRKLFKNNDSNFDIETSLLEYQLLLCLVRRLTDLHSNYFLNCDNFEKLISKMTKYLKSSKVTENNSNNGYLIFNQLPDENDLAFTVSKIIKWSSMSSDSTTGVYFLDKLLNEISPGGLIDDEK